LPYLSVTASPEQIDLGVAPFVGSHEIKGAFTLNVEANFLHGPIYLSATPLTLYSGCSIGPERVFVRTQTTKGFVATNKPVAISQPAEGSHKIVVDVKVDTPAGFPAGEYSGVFSLMIAPPV
jgi:hypothetical protein